MSKIKQLALEKGEEFVKELITKEILPAVDKAVLDSETKIDDGLWAVAKPQVEVELLKLADKIDGQVG